MSIQALNRIALALERIADHLESFTTEDEQQPEPEPEPELVTPCDRCQQKEASSYMDDGSKYCQACYIELFK